METINADCCYEIIKWISLVDQISLSEACRRWDALLRYHWSVHYKTFEYDFALQIISDKQFCTFIRKICAWVKSLTVKNMDRDKLCILFKYDFPEACDLYMTLVEPYIVTDYDMERLYYSFPNLTSFSPHGNFSGRYLTNWKKMKTLTLTRCSSISLHFFREILNELSLKELNLDTFYFDIGNLRSSWGKLSEIEKFSVNSHEIAWLIEDNIQMFQKLKRISISEAVIKNNVNKFCILLDKFRAADVRRIELYNDSSILLPFLFNMNLFSYLQSLVLNNLAVDRPTIRRLHEALASRPALANLYFISMEIESEQDILMIVENGVGLELLSIEGCSMTFPRIRIDVARAVCERDKPLRFNFYNNFSAITDGVGTTKIRVDLYGRDRLLFVTEDKIFKEAHGILRICLQAPDSDYDENDED